ncbi:MAG: glycosyltransferase family 92 protein, partial [Pseudomonadota bacterium]|nr:glycosyltransferase family 92 protein [Pseudomonadota bacterium]
MTNSRDEASWYLAAVCLFQNEAHNLDEWLGFCFSEGIEHVLLYDNFSTDNFRGVLDPWIAAGFVDLIDWPIPFDKQAQSKAYADALDRLRGRARWAAFIDTDEFLFSPTGQPVSETLEQYEGHAGVIVNWQCYGTSGHAARPVGLTIENYTCRAKRDWVRNRRVKTIVNPRLAVAPQGPHLFTVQSGEALVTEDMTPVQIVRTAKWRRRLRRLAAMAPYLPIDPYSTNEPSGTRISVSMLRINHYVTRSQEDLLLKYKDRNKMLDRDRQAYSRYHD